MSIVRTVEYQQPLDLGETDTVAFDFTDALSDSQTISSVTFAVTVDQGTDPSPEDLLQGSYSVSGTTVLQLVGGAGVRNTRYLIVCTVTTSDGRTLKAACLLPIVQLGQP